MYTRFSYIMSGAIYISVNAHICVYTFIYDVTCMYMNMHLQISMRVEMQIS